MAYVISGLKPKFFLFENVRGLLNAKWTDSGSNGEIFRDVLTTFESLRGYSVSWALVRAKDYGVPQNRPRVLLVGVRDDVLKRLTLDVGGVANGYLPKPVGDAPDLVDLLGDLVDPTWANCGLTDRYPSAARSPIQRMLRSVGRRVARKGSPLTEHEYSHHSPTVLAKFRAMHASGGSIPEAFKTKKFAQRLLPARWSSEGPTITATSLADDYVHFAQPRTLSVREWARLQLFPDWYRFAGKRTTGGIRRAGNPRAGVFDREVPKYTQIGNAVPVGLARAVGAHFARMLRV